MNKTYIIAEAGVNHNGSKELAYKLCDAAKAAGVDAVKFQTWKTEKICTKKASLATYQEANIKGDSNSQFDMLKKLELSYDDFIDIKDYCEKIGIQFLSTPDEEWSLQFLCSLNLPFIKVGSGEVTNIPYLRKIAAKHIPVILSTGMSDIAQVGAAYNTLMEYGAPEIKLLHCTTNYPCPMSEVNLNAMLTLREAFKCEVGYSDHTLGIEVPIAAVALGATIIEKHFTLDTNMPGPDHKASLNPEQLKTMVDGIRNIEVALGTGVKEPNASEKAICKVVLKSIVAARSIKKGETLTDESLTVRRSDNGIPAKYWDIVIGTQAIRDYEEDEPIKLF